MKCFLKVLYMSGNYFVHNCLHSPDGSGRTLTVNTPTDEITFSHERVDPVEHEGAP